MRGARRVAQRSGAQRRVAQRKHAPTHTAQPLSTRNTRWLSFVLLPGAPTFRLALSSTRLGSNAAPLGFDETGRLTGEDNVEGIFTTATALEQVVTAHAFVVDDEELVPAVSFTALVRMVMR